MARSLDTRVTGLLLSCVLTAACGSKGDDSGSPSDGGAAGDGGAMDSDHDGILDDDDPTPDGSAHNKLSGTDSGGAASVVEITATLGDGTENSAFVYNADLGFGCDASWYPQGTLCDEPDTTDSATTSTKTNPDSGATWYGDAYLGSEEYRPVTGILVVDACSDGSCEAVDFNEARVFQMFSDGKATQLRISVHTERGEPPPAWDDAGWTPVSELEFIGDGDNIDYFVVEGPTVIPTGPLVTRYLRFEVQNDGTVKDDDAWYIELRSVKLFSVPASG